uniref:L-dopachrome isomerase n=1 Tax=Bursaphelenchus xylophilus TaxID=6326 RepID=A0A1I7S5K4_BURXY
MLVPRFHFQKPTAMPLIEVRTNVKKEKIPAGFLKRLSQKGSELSLKPESLILAQINPDQIMSFAGTEEPCATVTFRCIGNIKDPKQIHVIAAEINKFISTELGIKPERYS